MGLGVAENIIALFNNEEPPGLLNPDYKKYRKQ
jgi:hypothetical protein